MELSGLAVDSTLTPGVLIAVIVIMILRGDLTPRWTLKMIVAAKDKTIAEQARHIEKQDTLIDDLYQSNALTEAVVGSLPRVLGTEPAPHQETGPT